MTKLSIAVITMNRAEQLCEALNSCLRCKLDKDTSFIIIDNASTDDTEKRVREVLGNTNYNYYYEKMKKNLGVGGGRNYAYSKSNSEYTYFLDDDALIDYENNPYFFRKAISILDKNPSIATLTTQIYDRLWEKNRVNEDGKKISETLFLCKNFCGGSHFLRNSFFNFQPYLPNTYGFEEIPSSIRVYNEKMINAFCSQLLVFHCPKKNKWNYNNKDNYSIIINECAVPYAIKTMMYPKIFGLVLKLGYEMRCKKYLYNIPDGKKQSDIIVSNTIREYKINYKISFRTTIILAKYFKISAF